MLEKPHHGLKLDALRMLQSILYVDTKVTNGALDFRMPKQDVNGAQVAGCLVDDRHLRSPQRVGAIFLGLQADPDDSFMNRARILACAHVRGAVVPAWEDIIIERSSASL